MRSHKQDKRRTRQPDSNNINLDFGLPRPTRNMVEFRQEHIVQLECSFAVLDRPCGLLAITSHCRYRDTGE